MKVVKRTLPFVFVVLIAWLPMLMGAFDKTKPAATTGLRASNPEILANWVALETAIDQDHDFTTGGTQTGKHEAIVMQEESAPTTAENELGFYAADDSGAPSLYIRPQSAGTAVKWTNNDATFNLSLLTSKTITTPTLTSPVFNTGVSGTAVLDEDNMASDSATKLATQQSIKAYVDSAPNFTPTSYAGEESITLPNGAILKHGYVTIGATSGSVTFGAAFSNAVVSIGTTLRYTTTTNNTVTIDNLATTGFSWYCGDASMTGFYWQVWGY